MAGEDNLLFVGFWKALTTAAGWILTVVSDIETLASPC